MRKILASLLTIGTLVSTTVVSAQVQCPFGYPVSADLGDGVIMHTCLWQKAPDETVRAGPLLLVKNGVPILSAQTNRAGRLHGRYVSWSDDGAILERGDYRDGLKQGVWLVVDEHGRRTSLHYLDGRLIGR